MKKKLSLLLILLLSIIVTAQKKRSSKMGQTTLEELKMKIYPKDSTAKALVLFDHANVYIDEDNNYDFRTDYYQRIKLFDSSEFERATIKINLYKKERVRKIEAITYNLKGEIAQKTFLNKKNIFTKEINDSWKETSFTLPNLKEGCVVEFKYSVISPYPDIEDWYFQQDIPVNESVHNTLILGNWKYKSRIVGYKKLDQDKATVKKNCLHIPGLGEGACVDTHYAMKDIPAFKEEDYMLSKKNFLSRVIFDLVSFTSPRGGTTKYTKTWDDADRTLKKWYLDNQTDKINFFKKNIPNNIKGIESDLEKAKKAYYFIQNRMAWNGKNRTKTIKVKKAFNEKTGSADAINLILLNVLKALNINSNVLMLSTRDNGLPTKLYPVTDDFNYTIVKTTISGKDYFLDASDKFSPFGQIPVKCLNGEGRVLDFKNGSYWQEINPNKRNSKNIRASLSFDDDNNLIGNLKTTFNGYYASRGRRDIDSNTKEEFLDEFESNHPGIEVSDFKVSNLEDKEKQLTTNYQITLDNDSNNQNTLKLNPFIYNRFTKNPFKLKERFYPVDYSYPRSLIYTIKIEIPKGYKVVKKPNDKAIGLPNNGGKYILKVNENEKSINVYVKYNINKKTYSSDEYYYLKEFINQIIKSQQKNIVFHKNI